MLDENGAANGALVARAKAIVMTPAAEWPRIAAERRSIGEIFTGYVVPLALIGPVCSFLGGQIFGFGAFGISYRPGLVSGLSMAVMQFVMSLVSLFLMMLIVEFLAPKFDGAASRLNAFKLVAYSMTAAWIAGVFGIVPSLGWLGILGLYSFYLFYTGVTPMMAVPAAKAMTFTVVTVICAIILSLVTGAIIGSIGATFISAPSFTGDGDLSGNVTVPGVGNIDVAKMEAVAKRAEAAATKPAVDAAKLQALLPASVAGFTRTSVESMAMGAAGSNAEGRYEKDGQSFRLSVTDMSAMGALTAMGAAMNVNSNKQDANGYERTQTVDGRIVSEKWNSADKSGEYGTTLAERFMVKAEGQVDDIAVLKGAVGSIGEGSLAGLVQ